MMILKKASGRVGGGTEGERGGREAREDGLERTVELEGERGARWVVAGAESPFC
jgi:hypothetical protein